MMESVAEESAGNTNRSSQSMTSRVAKQFNDLFGNINHLDPQKKDFASHRQVIY